MELFPLLLRHTPSVAVPAHHKVDFDKLPTTCKETTVAIQNFWPQSFRSTFRWIHGAFMSSDSVSVAFQLILEEIDSVVSEVNSQGAAFLRNSEYSRAEAAIVSGKKLAAFRVKLETLKEEWVTGLDEPTRKQVQIQTSDVVRTIASSSKSSKTVLVVKFSDGTVLFEPKAADTFAKALRKLGLQQVIGLGLKMNSHPLVSKQKSADYSQTEIDGYLVMTHSNTETKRAKLLEIAAELKVNLTVDVVPAHEL